MLPYEIKLSVPIRSRKETQCESLGIRKCKRNRGVRYGRSKMNEVCKQEGVWTSTRNDIFWLAGTLTRSSASIRPWKLFYFPKMTVRPICHSSVIEIDYNSDMCRVTRRYNIQNQVNNANFKCFCLSLGTFSDIKTGSEEYKWLHMNMVWSQLTIVMDIYY
jgi:hypothetical protein